MELRKPGNTGKLLLFFFALPPPLFKDSLAEITQGALNYLIFCKLFP